MKLHVLAVGDRLPRWVSEACADYQQRFPPHCSLRIEAVPVPRRGRNPDISALKNKEWRALFACVPGNARLVVLAETGRAFGTRQLSRKLDEWLHDGRDVAFLIGGPDGLAPAAEQAADETWSLSPLTLPHGLARVIVVEQLYRALSILADHPYHRG